MKDKSLKPIGKDTSAALTPQYEGIINRIQEIRKQDIPWTTKRALVKQALATLQDVYKSNLEALKVIAESDIIKKKQECVFQIRNEYMEMFQQIGLKVELSTLFECARDFDERCTKFKRELENNEKTDKQHKDTILKMIDDAYNRTMERLTELAGQKVVPPYMNSILEGETPIPRNTLEAEMTYFEKHRKELLKLYKGKYVAIKGDEVICVKDSADDIIQEVYTNGAAIKGRFVKGSEIGGVLIRKITKEPSEEFIFTTRDGTSNG